MSKVQSRGIRGVWLANARIRRLREEAVDDAVMLALRDDAEIGSRRLVGLIERNDGGLAQLMARFGGKPSRLVAWEYAP